MKSIGSIFSTRYTPKHGVLPKPAAGLELEWHEVFLLLVSSWLIATMIPHGGSNWWHPAVYPMVAPCCGSIWWYPLVAPYDGNL